MKIPCKWSQEFKQVWIHGLIRREQILVPANGFWFLRPFPANIPTVCADLYPRAWLYGIPAIWKEITHTICVDASDGAQKKIVPDVTFLLLCESKCSQTSLTMRLIDYHYVIRNLWPLFFSFFSHLPFSYSSTKIRSNKRGIRNNRVRIMRNKRLKKKEKNQVKLILVQNSGEWEIPKFKITGFKCIDILVLMGNNRFGATVNTSILYEYFNTSYWIVSPMIRAYTIYAGFTLYPMHISRGCFAVHTLTGTWFVP